MGSAMSVSSSGRARLVTNVLALSPPPPCPALPPELWEQRVPGPTWGCEPREVQPGEAPRPSFEPGLPPLLPARRRLVPRTCATRGTDGDQGSDGH